MFLLFCVALSVALPASTYNEEAEDCYADNCLASNGCVCASSASPLATADTPQVTYPVTWFSCHTASVVLVRRNH